MDEFMLHCITARKDSHTSTGAFCTHAVLHGASFLYMAQVKKLVHFVVPCCS